MLNQTCIECAAQFLFDDDDAAFLHRLSPSFRGRVSALPPPRRCPKCRLRTRLAFRNQIYVYQRPSSKSGTGFFSMFPEDSPHVIYSPAEWWSDSWDPLASGQVLDLSKPFFPQFYEVALKAPLWGLSALNPENSDYCNNVTEVKNCYLVFNSSRAEDCLYCENVVLSRDCMDCTHTPHSELCYDCVECTHCYAVQSSSFCDNCTSSTFLFHCQGCSDCFGCVNLRRKQYCIFNVQYTKAEYETTLRGIDLSSHSVRERYRKTAFELFLENPRPHVESRTAENITGNLIFESKSVKDSFIVHGAENCRYLFNAVHNVKDCYDFTTFGNGAELLYQCTGCGSNCFSSRFCAYCFGGSSDLSYCWACLGTKDCFGCVGLKRHQYCILNKQYTKDEYLNLVPQLIEQMTATGEWGEYFPASFSPIPYNHSYAQRYFPKSQVDAQRAGLRWYHKDPLAREKFIEWSQLPDALPPTDEPLVVRSAAGKYFRIAAGDIRRYRQFNTPLPRMSYDERMEERAKLLGGIELYRRTCPETGRTLESALPPDSPWIVWSKEAYEQEFSS